MLPLHLLRWLFVCLLFCAVCDRVPAQQNAALHRHDSDIKRCYDEHKRDSFLYYTTEKSRLARQADSLALWGWVQYRIQKFFSDSPAEALQRIDQSLKTQWRQPVDAAEAEPFLYLYTYQADYFLQRGLLVSAVSAGEAAAALYEQYRYADFDPVEGIYKALGNNYTRLGDNEKALAVFQKALQTGGNDETLSGLYNNIGTTHWNSGAYSDAAAFFHKGLALKQISDARRGLLYAGLAQVELDQGLPDFAFQTASRALQLLRKTATPHSQQVEQRARACVTAAEAAMATGRYRESEQLLLQAKKTEGLPPRDRGKINIARARLALLRGYPLEAMLAANEALQAVIPRFQPEKTADNPSEQDFYEENVLFEALAVKAAAAEGWYQKNGDPQWLYLALSAHDLAWKAEMRLRNVFRYKSSKLGLQHSARLREEAAMRVAYSLYEKTNDRALILHGFAIAERSKDMLLRDALQENIARRRKESGDPRFAELNLLRRNLADFEKRMLLDSGSPELPEWRQMADAVTTRINSLEFALKEQYPAFFERETNIGDYARLTGIPADGMLLEYFVSDAYVDVFVCMQHGTVAWHRWPNDADLQDLAGRFLAFFSDPNAILSAPESYFGTAFDLWQKIMPPEAATAGNLIIVPDGFLNFIPFEALLNERPLPGTSLRSAPYLLKKQRFGYAWSLSTLRRQEQLKSLISNTFLGVAPGFSHGERGLAPLPAAREEWSGLDRFDLQVLYGSQATADQLQQFASGARILHFSTHAFAGETPRIELYDAALLLPDIYTMPVGADLVVLSACQTGLGKEQKGEGVMSLARAFASGGAACVISSLWSVNDRSTARLFQRFYFHLGEKRATGAALRQAKLDYLADESAGAAAQSPYFWAGFLAVGAEREMTGTDKMAGKIWWIAGLSLFMVLLFLFRKRLY